MTQTTQQRDNARHRDMLAVLVTVLCLMSVSHSAPLTCESLIRPLVQLDPDSYEGRWALVAGNLGNASLNTVRVRDSITIDFHISSFHHTSSLGDRCFHLHFNVSVTGHIITFKENVFSITVTVLHTSCPDCLVLTWDVDSPSYQMKDLYLFSRRREVTQKEMEEFRAQAECLNMPPAFVMDPAKNLCPLTPE